MGEGIEFNSSERCGLRESPSPFSFSRDPLLGATVGGVCSLARSQHAHVFVKGLLPTWQTTPKGAFRLQVLRTGSPHPMTAWALEQVSSG